MSSYGLNSDWVGSSTALLSLLGIAAVVLAWIWTAFGRHCRVVAEPRLRGYSLLAGSALAETTGLGREGVGGQVEGSPGDWPASRGSVDRLTFVGQRDPGALRRYLLEDGHHIDQHGKTRCLSPDHEDRNPSAHVYAGSEGGRVYCFACGFRVDAFTYLVERRGLSKRQALEVLGSPHARARRPGSARSGEWSCVRQCPNAALPAPIIEAHMRRAAVLARVPAALDARGFAVEDLRRLAVAAGDEGAIIPITGTQGQVLRLKLRRGPGERSPRYCYVDGVGEGTPAWCSPGWGNAGLVLVMEGELNAAAAWCARPHLDVVGVAGTSGSLPLSRLAGRVVVLYADGDEAGMLARDRWARALHMRGCKVSMLPAWPEGDACDIAYAFGRGELRRRLS